MTSDPVAPDTKDWTWVLDGPCLECGFVASSVPADQVSAQVLALTAPWTEVLARPGAAARPEPGRWSALEYACHVRDVCRVFAGRVRLMLGQEDPGFATWDQDEAAVRGRYGEQDPAVVSTQLVEDGRWLAEAFDHVADEQWQRTGVRSNGSAFTVLTLGQYALHDLAHHLGDVGAARP